MKHFDSFIRICFITAILIGTTHFCQKMTDGFSISAISSNRPHHPEYETRALSANENAELNEALNQPYHYYGVGGQVFVFFSSDGKYALKFFKQRLFRPSWLLNHFPLPKLLHRYRTKRNWKRDDKFKRDFFSYQASFEELQKETALLYCHLNRTSHLQKRVEIIDPLKIHHFLELDQFDFIIQRRAERVFERIERDAREENFADASETFAQILKLIESCIKKGFYNRDPYIPNNCGLIGKQAILIDVGRFVRNDQITSDKGYAEEFRRITGPFESWLKANFPQMLPLFQERLQEVQ